MSAFSGIFQETRTDAVRDTGTCFVALAEWAAYFGVHSLVKRCASSI
jgi:hypothetical protein